MPERQLNTQDTMTMEGEAQVVEPVRKSIRVRADAARAFRIFTEEMDSWWPRTHHIGSSPMKRVVVEGRPMGAIFTEQEDGTNCPWGSVLTWEPPHLFVMAWQIKPDWQFEPDLSKCSEVEVRFTPADDGTTLVELEHRGLQRHGMGCAKMREQVNAEGGWGGLLGMFAAKADEEV
ncbi:SRPBCC family protein [Tunturiibacter gelidiferens]|uniref:SRPBCC family protein n=1 Tax=Tunturiibacter gelidiferens TaxID=3069689 RepID=A0AAU7Z272_9BACT